MTFDLVIVGAGTAGLSCAIEASGLGLSVCLLDKADRIGGTLYLSAGQMSAAGSHRQRERGISDTPDAHFDDVMRISRNTADPVLVRKAVDMAAATIDWLLAGGFEMEPACPVILHYHEAYRTPRTYWGVEGGLSVLKVLAAKFEAARGVELRLNTAVTDIAVDGDRIDHLVLRNADGSHGEVRGKTYVVTTGGYGNSPELFARFSGGRPLFSCAAETSTGDAFRWADRIGLVTRGEEHYLPTFAGVETAPETGRVLWSELPSLTPQTRMPFEIYVTRDGKRLVREDSGSVDERERALKSEPDLTFFIVYDSHIRDAAPPLFPGWSASALAAAHEGQHHAFERADSIAELGRKAGIDPANLEATVAAYNSAVTDGGDLMGRRHMPFRIEKGPFYSVRCHGVVLRTSAGIVVNERLQPLTKRGPISNMRIAGEALGGGALSGNSFVGGMSVTPAISFGRWIAHDCAAGMAA